MSDSAKEAWTDVGERFTVWGRGVAERYRGTSAAESEAVETETEMKRAAKELIDELSRGINALGETFRDDQAKRDLADAVSAIGDAITKTVNEASEGLRAGRSSSADDGPKDGA